MKKQRLITGEVLKDFHEIVNLLLTEGWRVVPGTLVMSVSSTNRTFGGLMKVDTATLYGIVLEEP